jgi:hypothetical protein
MVCWIGPLAFKSASPRVSRRENDEAEEAEDVVEDEEKEKEEVDGKRHRRLLPCSRFLSLDAGRTPRSLLFYVFDLK